jgi:integrase-like protein
VRALQPTFELSERRACAPIGLGRSTCRYQTIETWRLDYNAVRPHYALGNVPPTAKILST